MYNFDEFDEDDIKALLIEFDNASLNDIPKPGTRGWYLMAFAHWILGEILQGNNPLPNNTEI